LDQEIGITPQKKIKKIRSSISNQYNDE
jgi:hypothetical protein